MLEPRTWPNLGNEKKLKRQGSKQYLAWGYWQRTLVYSGDKCSTGAKGSVQEKSEPLWKSQRQLLSENAVSQTSSEQCLFALFPANRAFSLEVAIELKHPLPNTISSLFSICALSMKNFRKASSLRSPRKSWNTIILMCVWMHSMGPDSCQNLILSLPVDSRVFCDCTSVQSLNNTAGSVILIDALINAKWNDQSPSLTWICSFSMLGKHLRKLGSILTSLRTSNRTFTSRILTVGPGP